MTDKSFTKFKIFHDLHNKLQQYVLDPSSATLNKYEQLVLSLSGDMADLLEISRLWGFKLKTLIKFNKLTLMALAEGLKV